METVGREVALLAQSKHSLLPEGMEGEGSKWESAQPHVSPLEGPVALCKERLQ